MTLDRHLRGKLLCANEHGFSFAGEGVLVAVLPGPLIVCPRNSAQGASLKSLPSEFQGRVTPVQSEQRGWLYLSLCHVPATNSARWREISTASRLSKLEFFALAPLFPMSSSAFQATTRLRANRATPRRRSIPSPKAEMFSMRHAVENEGE